RVHQEERARLHQQLQTLIRHARESAGLTLGTEYFGAEFLLTATDAFLERLYSGQDPRLQVAVGSPDLLRQNMAAIWDRAILNPSPIADYL
ncbi:MAG: hypothetical protein R3360_07500, partial [Alphaproteobacteria bacterium]|nr:hypothetical protein [Alphaproteobacteria bacterium]